MSACFDQNATFRFVAVRKPIAFVQVRKPRPVGHATETNYFVGETHESRKISSAQIAVALFAILWVGVIANLGMDVTASCNAHAAQPQQGQEIDRIPDFKAGRHSMCRGFSH